MHRLLREPEVKDAIVERFGQGILDAAGEIVRSRVAEVVFADRGQLQWLEALLHPRVAQEYLVWRDELAAREHPPAVCATEVPLLYEVGGETRFDAVVVITAPRDLRGSRALVSPEQREARLIPDEDKVRRARFAYVNDGSLDQLDAFVGEVVTTLESER